MVSIVPQGFDIAIIKFLIDMHPRRCYIYSMLNSPLKHSPFAAAGQAISLVGDVA
jgi:hypothetical protein